MERFWSKVDKSGDCWEWQAGRNWKGYGKFHLDGRTRGAHRVAWELTHGVLPEELNVLHKCDNPCCVNPDHLFLGTSGDNRKDMYQKGRGCDKERHHLAKLDAAKVRDIRRSSYTNTFLAQLYGVHHSTISEVRSGKTWKGVI